MVFILVPGLSMVFIQGSLNLLLLLQHGLCGRIDVIKFSEISVCHVLACRALTHVLDFSCVPANLDGKKLLLNNFSHVDGSFLFISSYWNAANDVSGAGFFCFNSYYYISFAGSCSIQARNAADAKLLALKVALESDVNEDILIRHLFITNDEAFKSINHLHSSSNDSLHFGFPNLNHLLISTANPCIYVIPKTWASPPYKLAIHGVNLHSLALFHQGSDLPYWIMKCFKCLGFEF